MYHNLSQTPMSDNQVGPITCIIRNPCRFLKWKSTIQRLCNNEMVQELLFSFDASSVHINGRKQVDSQSVIEGHTFEFPKNFFTVLIVPKGTVIDILINPQVILQALSNDQNHFRLKLTIHSLMVNQEIVDGFSINQRRSQTPNTSYIHRRSITSTPVDKVEIKEMPLAKRLRSHCNSEILELKPSIFKPNTNMALLTKPTPTKNTSRIPVASPMAVTKDKKLNGAISEWSDSRIEIHDRKFKLRHLFPNLGKEFDIYAAFPGHDKVLAEDSRDEEEFAKSKSAIKSKRKQDRDRVEETIYISREFDNL